VTQSQAYSEEQERRVEILRARLTKKLAGFSHFPAEEHAKEVMVSFRPDRALFPVPDLALYALRDVMGWRWHGPGEKTRWTVHGAFQGHRLAFALEKFGFTIFLPKARPDLRDRVEGQLRSRA
jgi:hypothetical protein